MEGATSASLPPPVNATSGCALTAISGTGLQVCAVNSLPVAKSIFCSALPWSAVTSKTASAFNEAVSKRPIHSSTTSSAAMIACHFPVCPTISGLARFMTIRGNSPEPIALSAFSVISRAPFPLLVVGADLTRRRHENALFAGKRLFASAGKKIGDVRVLLGFREAKLSQACVGNDFAKRPAFEDLAVHHRVGKGHIVQGHEREDKISKTPDRKLGELRIGKGPRELTRPIRPEIEEQTGIAVFHDRLGRSDDNRTYELIGFAACVRRR